MDQKDGVEEEGEGLNGGVEEAEEGALDLNQHKSPSSLKYVEDQLNIAAGMSYSE